MTHATAEGSIDVLVVTFRRPHYTRLTLERLLSTCDERMRVWIWHNGTDRETLDVVREFLGHSRVYEFHHSRENVRLRPAINWLFARATGRYFSVLNDDMLVPEGWADTFRTAHADVPEFGVLGLWPFSPDDFDLELAEWKIQYFHSHRLLRNNWVQGSGILMKREVYEEHGFIPQGRGLTSFCTHAAARGWVNGWYYPLVIAEHMDDPRSPHSQLMRNEDLSRTEPLTAVEFGIETVDERVEQIRYFARTVQTAPIHPRAQVGWRRNVSKARRKLRRILSRGVYRKVA